MSIEHPSVNGWAGEQGLTQEQRVTLLTQVLVKTPRAPEAVGPEASPALKQREERLKSMREKILHAMAVAVVSIASGAEVGATMLEAVGQARPDAAESMAEVLAKVEEERREAAKKDSFLKESHL